MVTKKKSTSNEFMSTSIKSISTVLPTIAQEKIVPKWAYNSPAYTITAATGGTWIQDTYRLNSGDRDLYITGLFLQHTAISGAPDSFVLAETNALNQTSRYIEYEALSITQIQAGVWIPIDPPLKIASNWWFRTPILAGSELFSFQIQGFETPK
jgi:hypothetical protein